MSIIQPTLTCIKIVELMLTFKVQYIRYELTSAIKHTKVS